MQPAMPGIRSWISGEKQGKPVMVTEYGQMRLPEFTKLFQKMFSEEYQMEFTAVRMQNLIREAFYWRAMCGDLADFATVQGCMRGRRQQKGTVYQGQTAENGSPLFKKTMECNSRL